MQFMPTAAQLVMVSLLLSTLLASQAEQAENEREEKQTEFRKRQRVLDDFPTILKTLEDATLPLQEYLDVKLTEGN